MSSTETDSSASTVPQPSGLSTGQKVHNGLYTAKCAIVGGFFSVAGVMLILQGGSTWIGGLGVLAYGIWLLSGMFSGGWRLFVY